MASCGSSGAAFQDLTVGQRVHLLLCLVISQACWWTAIIIGFINGQF
jgi:hypothetical protein